MNRNYQDGFNSVLAYRFDVGKGKSCGKGFISSSKKCNVGQGKQQLSSPESGFFANESGEKLKTSLKISKDKLVIGAVFAGFAVAGVAALGLSIAQKQQFKRRAEEAVKNATKQAEDAFKEYAKADEARSNEFRQNASRAAEASAKKQGENYKKKKAEYEAWAKRKKEEYRRQAEEHYKEWERDYQEWEDNFYNRNSNPRPWWDVLGVKENSSKQEIKNAWKKKAREFHPDVNKDSRATKWMQEINNALDNARSQGKADSTASVWAEPKVCAWY